MKILYTSNMCSNKEFKRIFDMCKIKPLQSIQKFNKLLCDGFIANGSDVSLLSSAPVNRKMCKKIFFRRKSEVEDDIKFNYCAMINLPFLKYISLFFSSIKIVKKWCKNVKKDEEKIIIYDAYCPVISNVAVAYAKKYNIDVVALYTDVPKCMDSSLKKSKNIMKRILNNIYISMDNKSNKIAKGYILLTEQMNEVVNKDNKPYIVVEGMVDYKIKNEKKDIEKYKDFTLMYAGGLYEKYGVKMLVEAVEKLKEVKLNLYGEGELVSWLKTKYSKSQNINYGGTLLNDEILLEEKRSTLLVNPRFTNEEYTKYSFPSKNMEYMVSGTPLLTTKLPGMPEEYNDYIYLIKNENLEGFILSIRKAVNQTKEQREKKGKKAQQFVLENKNNIEQTKRIINFINNNFVVKENKK